MALYRDRDPRARFSVQVTASPRNYLAMLCLRTAFALPTLITITVVTLVAAGVIIVLANTTNLFQFKL